MKLECKRNTSELQFNTTIDLERLRFLVKTAVNLI